MKVNVSSALVFALSGTLMGQSEIGRSEQSAFPAQIKHVVVIFQENRTPDNLFQSLRPLCPIPAGAKGLNACTPSPVTDTCYNISPCGLSNESGSVKPVPLTKASLAGTSDPSHSHSAFEKMCDPDPARGYACRNDGAWRIEHGVAWSNDLKYMSRIAVLPIAVAVLGAGSAAQQFSPCPR